MQKAETLLVVLDPRAKAKSAIERGAWLAARTGADLELFAVEYNQYVDPDERARESLLHADRSRLNGVADELRTRDLIVDVDVRWHEREDEAIVRKTVESNPALVIKETHYHSLLQRTLFTPTDWTLIRHCAAPLLLVKDRPLGSPPRLLAAVDPARLHDKPDDLDHRILKFAQDLAQKIEGRTHVIHVLDPTPAAATLAAATAPEAAGIGAAQHDDLLDEISEERRKSFRQLLEAESIDAGHGRVEQGEPSDTLIRCATDLDADFVIMGAVSRSRWRSVFIGHTAERVLDRLPCDLIVVKPQGFRDDMAVA